MSKLRLLIAVSLGALALAACAPAAPGQSLAAQEIYAESYLRDVQAGQAATQEADARRAIDASLQATEAAASQAAADAQDAINAAEAERLELVALAQDIADAEARRELERQAAEISNTIAISNAIAQQIADSKVISDTAAALLDANLERIENDRRAAATQSFVFTIAAIAVAGMISVVCVLLARYVFDLYQSEKRKHYITESAYALQVKRSGVIPEFGWQILPDGSMIVRVGDDIRAAHAVLGQLPPAPKEEQEPEGIRVGGRGGGYSMPRAGEMNDSTRAAYDFLIKCREITGPATMKIPTADSFVRQHKCRREYWQQSVRLMTPVYLNGRPGKGTFIVHARYPRLGSLIAGIESGEIVIADPSDAPRVPAERVSVSE